MCREREKRKKAFRNLGIIFAIIASELLWSVVSAHHIFRVRTDGDT
jgi:hypothetical protein